MGMQDSGKQDSDQRKELETRFFDKFAENRKKQMDWQRRKCGKDWLLRRKSEHVQVLK